jgi:hypothetical protein
MTTWQQFLEAKKTDTSKLDCVMDLAQALQEVFKRYTLTTREAAWKKLTGKDGERKVRDLIKTPSRSLSPFRTLVP